MTDKELAAHEDRELQGKMITKDNLPVHGWGRYKKRTITKARRMDGPFTVVTREGPLECPDGYLALDSAGFPYPIAKEELLVIYQESDDAKS